MKRNSLVFSTLILFSLNLSLNAQQSDKTLFIYQDGNVLVHDVKTLSLQRGIQEVDLEGLPELLIFESLMIRLKGNVHGVRWTPSVHKGLFEVLESLVGKAIRLEHPQGHTINGTLTHAANGSVLIRLGDGSQTLVQHVQEYTINTTEWPQFGTSNTITARLEPSRAGVQPIELTYFVPGLTWSTRYAMIISDDDKTASLSGWTQLLNSSDQIYDQVQVRLVTGVLNRSDKQVIGDVQQMRFRGSSSLSAELSTSPEVSAAAFGDLQLFTLAGKHTLNRAEQLRVPLLFADAIQTQKRYRYTSLDRFHEFPQGGLIRVQYDVANTKRNKLGTPIPTGVVSLYRMDNGQPVMIGEETIGNIPMDGTVSVTIGNAFDILVKESMISTTRISDRLMEQTTEIQFQNRKEETITIELERYLLPNQRITSTGHPFTQRSARYHVAELTIPAGDDLTVQFTIRTER
jgi:hypothetical protein